MTDPVRRPRRVQATWWDRALELIDSQQRVDRAQQLLRPLLIACVLALAVCGGVVVAVVAMIDVSASGTGLAALAGGGGVTAALVSHLRRRRPR